MTEFHPLTAEDVQKYAQQRHRAQAMEAQGNGVHPAYLKTLGSLNDWVNAVNKTSDAKADLSGLDLSGLDLTTVDFSHTKMQGTNLTGAILPYANFTGTDLTGATLDKAVLNCAKLVGTKLDGASANDITLDRTTIDGVSAEDLKTNHAGFSYFLKQSASEAALGEQISGLFSKDDLARIEREERESGTLEDKLNRAQKAGDKDAVDALLDKMLEQKANDGQGSSHTEKLAKRREAERENPPQQGR